MDELQKGEILIYQSESGDTRIDVYLEEGTVWLSQSMITELYQTTPQNIIMHTRNIYKEGELDEAFATVGQGRISLSSTACKMIENIYELKYVEAHAGKVNDTTEKIGLRFSKTKTQNSLCYARRKYKGEYVEGLVIRSKALIAEFFGKIKDNSSTRHPVEKIDNSMIAIDITKEMQ